MYKEILTTVAISGAIVAIGADKVDAASLYTKANLNIRSGPSTSYYVKTTIPKGSEIKYLKASNGWYKVQYKNIIGWVSSLYVTTNKPTTTNNAISNKYSNLKTLDNLIVVNQRYLTVKMYKNGNQVFVANCAVGKASTPTPNKKFTIVNKEKNRPYYSGNIPGGSPKNPLGSRFMQFMDANGRITAYAIHGTNNDNSIGTHASNGCIRMHNWDVNKLYNITPLYTTVIITNSTSNKLAVSQYGIYINK